MSRPETTGRKLGFSIPAFCRAHDFSRAHYYKLKSLGQGPDETLVAGKIVITEAAALKWIKQFRVRPKGRSVLA
jgi:hypothetical protein